MNRSICGEFPKFCYRAFDREEYARQFIEYGVFRMGCLLSYRKSEGIVRRDETEGEAHMKEPGIVSEVWFSRDRAEKPVVVRERGHRERGPEIDNCIYCLCTSLPDVRPDHIRTFGEYIVRIDDPRKLAEDINAHLVRTRQRFLIEGCNVVYNKGQKLDKELTVNERLDLPYRQKPESFRTDCEFRIVAIKLGEPCPETCKYLDGQFEGIEPPCRFIEIGLGRRLDYVIMVSSG